MEWLQTPDWESPVKPFAARPPSYNRRRRTKRKTDYQSGQTLLASANSDWSRDDKCQCTYSYLGLISLLRSSLLSPMWWSWFRCCRCRCRCRCCCRRVALIMTIADCHDQMIKVRIAHSKECKLFTHYLFQINSQYQKSFFYVPLWLVQAAQRWEKKFLKNARAFTVAATDNWSRQPSTTV